MHWWLVIWPFDRNGIFPDSCFTAGWNKCICICGVKSLATWTDRGLKEDCDNRGMCKEFKSDLIIKYSNFLFEFGNDYIQIQDPPLELNINYRTKEITKK